jgi:hypothetical protein
VGAWTRTAALIAALVGAVGSLALMLIAGRRNPSRLLIVLFAAWVLSPFVMLVIAHARSKQWSDRLRAALYVVMLVVTLYSLAIYATVALSPPRPQGAFVFVVVPPASWLLISVVIGAAALKTWNRSRPRR